MSNGGKNYFDFCEWAIKEHGPMSDVDLSREFVQGGPIYMAYLASNLLTSQNRKG